MSRKGLRGKRLWESKLTTLEITAIRADMKQVYKIMNGGLWEKDFFKRDEGRGRGHTIKLFKKRMRRLDIAKNSVGSRVCIISGTILSPAAVISSSQGNNTFKGGLDNCMRNRGAEA